MCWPRDSRSFAKASGPAAAGGYLLLWRQSERTLRIAALAYGAAMALTFDEFGMRLHLGGSYWQRASIVAVVVVAAVLALRSPVNASIAREQSVVPGGLSGD